MGLVFMADLEEAFKLDDRVSVGAGHNGLRYTGTVVKIIHDHKNLKILLILEGVPFGNPCRVDSSDCRPIQRGP